MIDEHIRIDTDHADGAQEEKEKRDALRNCEIKIIIFLCLWEMIPGSYSGVKIENASRFTRTIFRCYFCSEKCVLGQLRLLVKTSNKSWYWTKESAFSGPKSEHVFATFKLLSGKDYTLNFATEPFQRGLSSYLVWVFDDILFLKGTCFIFWEPSYYHFLLYAEHLQRSICSLVKMNSR